MDRYSTTIVVADLVGYSRLMTIDEEEVFSRMRSLRHDVVAPLVSSAGGRIIKTMGDGILIEFPSPLAAANQVIEIQRQIAKREAGQAEERRFRFRVGINHGSALVDGDDLLGDVVNVAARLEGLAPAGGVCLSKPVFEAIDGEIDGDLTALGPKLVKNIPEPVEVWRLDFDGMDAATAVEPLAAAPLAVLPFTNLSGGTDQDFLANGLVEDVLTELSRFRYLSVISNNSTFALKNTDRDLQEIAVRLGAHYIVEGSVAVANGRVRLRAKLFDATTGTQVWAEKFDRKETEIFDLQDDLTAAIIAGVAPNVGAHERHLARRKPTQNLTAWELCQRALGEFYTYAPPAHERAREYLIRAIAEDPEFSLPHSYLARLLSFRVNSGITSDPQSDVRDGLVAAARAIELDDRNELAFAMQAVLLGMAGQIEPARLSLKRARKLNPNNSEVYFAAYSLELFSPEPDPDAILSAVNHHTRLSPDDPGTWAREISLGYGYLLADGGITPRFAEIAKASTRHANTPAFPFVFAAAAHLKFQHDQELAKEYLNNALKRKPDLVAADLAKIFQFPSWPRIYQTVSIDLDRLKAIGLPEA